MTKKPNIEDVAKEWIGLKTQLKEIEKSIDELKPNLEEYLSQLPEHSEEFHGWRFSLVEFVKESFSLSKAKEKIDGRTLAPYITETSVTQIRTSWQGGEEKKAA
jgi:hypothetical protein